MGNDRHYERAQRGKPELARAAKRRQGIPRRTVTDAADRFVSSVEALTSRQRATHLVGLSMRPRISSTVKLTMVG